MRDWVKLNLSPPHSRFVIFFLIFISSASIHFRILLKDPLLRRDDILLVSAVDSVTGPADYLEKLMSGFLFDIQPVRDLTFYVNLKLYYLTGYGAFHLTNLLLIFFLIVLMSDMLGRQGYSPKIIFLCCLLFCLHPLSNSIAASVSNRKHLLAVLFLMFYVREELKPRSFGWRKNIYITFGLLSQPIIVFVPILVIIFKRIFLKVRSDYSQVFSVLICLTVLISNYWYYDKMPQFTGRNLIDAQNTDLGLYILKILRVPVQIFFPVSLAAEYNPGNMLSFLGIVLFVLSGYFFIKYAFTWKRLYLALVCSSTLFPVLRWGPRDAYLLVTLVGVIFTVGPVLSRYEGRRLWVLMTPIYLCLAFQSYKFTNMWMSDTELARMSYEIEGGAENLAKYAFTITSDNPDLAYQLYNKFVTDYPQNVIPTILARRANTLYNARHILTQEKIAEFNKNPMGDVFSLFFLAKVIKETGDNITYRRVTQELKSALREKKKLLFFHPLVCRKYYRDCQELGIYL